MKGISDIVAMLLMLVITIAIAGLAYAFITGVFTSRTAVALSLDPQSTSCNSTHFIFYVRNDGSSASGLVTIRAIAPDGNDALNVGCATCCNITSVPAMFTSNVTCARAAGKQTGGYRITISAPGASPYSTTYYCAVAS
jgi:flagellin-like protein